MKTANCLRCGRKLTNKRSVERGYGSGCLKKISLEDKKTEVENINQETIIISNMERRKEKLEILINEDKLDKLIESGFDVSALSVGDVIGQVNGEKETLSIKVAKYAIVGLFLDKNKVELSSCTLEDPFEKEDFENVLIGAFLDFKEYEKSVNSNLKKVC